MNRFERMRTAYSNLYAWAAYSLFTNDSFEPVIDFIPGMHVVSRQGPRQVSVGNQLWDLHDIAAKLDDVGDVNDWCEYFYENITLITDVFDESNIQFSGTVYMMNEEFIKGWINLVERAIIGIAQNRNLNAEYAADNYWVIRQLTEIKYILEDAFRQED